jgi:hypothetical protein
VVKEEQEIIKRAKSVGNLKKQEEQVERLFRDLLRELGGDPQPSV